MTVVRNLRQHFRFPEKGLKHYFPMHMAKGMEQLKQRLQDVDCIIEVHDARIPLSGRNVQFRQFIGMKPHMMLLNKVDLFDNSQSADVESALKRQGIERVLYTNCLQQKPTVLRDELLPRALELIKSRPRFHREEEDSFNLIIVGVPNVGKSSLINALRRIHLKRDGKATPVGAKPGITRAVLERIKVSANPLVYVYDSPGIISPTITDMHTGMKLALCATLQDHLVGEDLIVDYLLYWLNSHQRFEYVTFFNLPEPTDNVYEFLTHVAKQKNNYIQVRSAAGTRIVRPNLHGAANLVLQEFRKGHLGRYNLDIDLINSQTRQQEPTSLSS